MSQQPGSLRKSLPLVILATVALQLTACKEEKSSSRANIAGKANPNAKKEAAEKKAAAEKSKTEVAKAEKKEETAKGTPAPDQIPALNTSGHSFMGSLKKLKDDKGVVKNDQCSIEIVAEEGKKVAVLSLGGDPVKIPLKKEWATEFESLNQEALQVAQGKNEVIAVGSSIQINNSVKINTTGDIQISRELYLANEDALGSKDISKFIEEEKKKLFADKDYTAMGMVKDFLIVSHSDKKFASYKYKRASLVPGTGGTAEAKYTDEVSVICESLKSEKK